MVTTSTKKTRASEEALYPTGYSRRGSSACIISNFKTMSKKI